jgi:hypothetical protein
LPKTVPWTRPITDWEIEQADHDERAAEAGEEKKLGRRHHADKFKYQIENFSTAKLGSGPVKMLAQAVIG